MKRYADFVMSARSALGAQALGWYSFNARQTQAAAAWFETSLSFEANENAALGLAFAYRKLADRAAFARVIATYGAQFAKVADLANGGHAPKLEERRAVLETDDPAPARVHRVAAVRALAAPVERDEASRQEDGGSIASALNAKNYTACVTRADAAAREGPLNIGQQNALGWCLLNLGRGLESARAFDTSLKSATGKQHQEAAYGKSLALLAGGETMQAGAAAGQAKLAPDQRNSIGLQILEQRAWAAAAAKRYAEALTWLDRRVAFAPETRDLMGLRARCLDNLGRGDAANAIRAELDQQLTE
jgi:tetratricopeptide (TPR) repeat protein